MIVSSQNEKKKSKIGRYFVRRLASKRESLSIRHQSHDSVSRESFPSNHYRAVQLSKSPFRSVLIQLIQHHGASCLYTG